MELQEADRHLRAGLEYRFRRGIHEEANHLDKGRNTPREFSRPRRRDVARAFRIEDKTERIRPGGHSRIDIGLTGEPADLDSRHRNTASRKSSAGSGKPQCGSYTGPRKYKPSGEKVGAASLRSFISKSASTQLAGCAPFP